MDFKKELDNILQSVLDQPNYTKYNIDLYQQTVYLTQPPPRKHGGSQAEGLEDCPWFLFKVRYDLKAFNLSVI